MCNRPAFLIGCSISLVNKKKGNLYFHPKMSAVLMLIGQESETKSTHPPELTKKCLRIVLFSNGTLGAEQGS